MSTITRNQNRRVLLTNTQVPVVASKSVTSITRSGTTATLTATTHGLVVGDWFVVQGADRPIYNGPFQVVTQADANTITYTLEADPGASAGGTITLQKVVGPTNLWGDGTTPTGSLASIGALPTAEECEVEARVATTTAPTTACRLSVYDSLTGTPGSWRLVQEVDTTTVANDMSTHIIRVDRSPFVLVLFWRVAGTAVYVDVAGKEVTSHTIA